MNFKPVARTPRNLNRPARPAHFVEDWVYNWPQILDDMEAGLYNTDQLIEIKNAAYSWVTCAVGTQCARIPRYPSGTPLDDHLSELGASFWTYVREGLVDEARRVLAKIETRSAEILKMMEEMDNE